MKDGLVKSPSGRVYAMRATKGLNGGGGTPGAWDEFTSPSGGVTPLA